MKDVKTLEAQIVGVAQGMLSDEVSLIEGSRHLVQLSGRLGNRDDELFAPIVAVDSETDDLPLGEARLHWSKEALRKKDEAVASYLHEVRDEILGVCEALVRKYSREDC